MRTIQIRLYLLLLLIPFSFACTPSEDKEPEKENPPEFYLADISKYSKDFDEVLFKDDNHVLFTSHYSNGVVKAFLVMCEQDTLIMAFSQKGLPRYMTDGHNQLVFCGYSKTSTDVAIIDETGEYEFEDWEADINWKEYINTMVATKGDDKIREKDKENAQIGAFLFFAEKFASRRINMPGPSIKGAIITFAAQGLAYRISDNATWWEVVDCVSAGHNIYTAGKVMWYLGKTIPSASFAVADVGFVVVTTWATWEVMDGMEKGQFRNPFVPEKHYDAIDYRLKAAVWLDPSSARALWPGLTGKVSMKVDIAFDEERSPADSPIQFGTQVWGKPDWIDVEIVNNGDEHYFTYTVHPNLSYSSPYYGDRTATLQFYALNYHDNDDPLEFTITQHSRVRAVPSRICFTDEDPITVEIHSTSEESWYLTAWPEWLDVKRIEAAPTQRIQGLILTPIQKEFKDKLSSTVVLTVNSVIEKQTYEVEIPVDVSLGLKLCPDNNHPHAIDLGLGVKWACCNVGAHAPEEYGDYYAWGETEEKKEYSYSSYKWSTPFGGYSKYNNASNYYEADHVDNKTRLDEEDDVAHVKMGGRWRMPTSEEGHLIYKCTWEWVTINGIRGRLYTGLNGNKLFLPAAGAKIGTHLVNVGYCAYFRSSEIPPGNADMPGIMYYWTSGYEEEVEFSTVRYYGFSVRAIMD